MFMFNYDYSTASTGITMIMLLTIVVGVVGLASIFINDIKNWIKKKKEVDK